VAGRKEIYQQWRDAWLEYDVDKAKQLLDEAGVKDTDGDGFREFPDGGKITLQLDYPADTSKEHISKSQQLKRDWEAVGIAVRILPSAPTTFGDRWGRGDMFAHAAWEVGDCQPLLYAGWVVPVAPDHWAPLHGTAYSMKLSAPDTLTSKSQLDKPPWKRNPPFAVAADDLPLSPVFTKLQGLLDQARVETDTTKQMSLLWDIYKVHIDEGPFFYGIVNNYPRPVVQHPDLRNNPRRENLALGGWTNPWFLPAPATYDPETFYWDNPDSHKITA